MKHLGALALLLAAGSMTLMAETAAEGLTESANVLNEIMDTPIRAFPKTSGFIVGAKYGRGFVVCRKANRAGWGPPAAMRMEGGSFGFQIGVSETDVILLVMNRRGMDGILSSKFTLGGGRAGGGWPGGPQQHRPDGRNHEGQDSFLLPFARRLRWRGFSGCDPAPGQRREQGDVR